MIPLQYNLRNLAVRRTTTFAAGGGIALVVFVFASVLMLAHGIRRTLGKTGRPDTAIVLRKGADTEMSSGIDDPHVGLIIAQKEVVRSTDGQPQAIGEVVVVAALDKIDIEGAVANVQIRGVSERVMGFRPEARIIEGRAASPGSDEVIIGKRIRGRFKGVELGQSFEVRKNRPVKVVGVFEAGGSMFESEVWADIDTVRTSFRREGIVSSVRARLIDPASFDAFKLAIEQNRQLGLDVVREPEYYEKQSEGSSMFIQGIGLVIAIFFSFGAMIGAMITMFAQVANRSREVGTLRALGFSRGSILASFLFESVVLAFSGGIVGLLASMGMTFVHFSTMNFASWSEIAFSFEPTPQILLSALLFAAIMGVFGGFFPALRAAQISPLRAMRD